MITQLCQARTTEVPGIVAELRSYSRWAQAKLTWIVQNAEPSSRERLHALLALGADDAKQAPLLLPFLGNADPTTAHVIVDSLAAHRERVIEPLDEQLRRSSEPAGRRFRAALALARLAPDRVSGFDDSGKPITILLADQLIVEAQASALNARPLIEGLRPVHATMLGPLSRHFRDPSKSESEHLLAATVLADFASDRPEVLAELVLDASPVSLPVLMAALVNNTETAVGRMEAEVTRRLQPVWDDPPQKSAWPSVDDETVRQIESASGMVSEPFAFCQALPLNRLTTLADRLQHTGYRPARLRPYSTERGTRVAAIWTRDGRHWRVLRGTSYDELTKRAGELQQRGYQPADVALYPSSPSPTSPLACAALFVKESSDDVDARITIDLLGEDRRAGTCWQELINTGFAPIAWQGERTAGGATLAAVWTRSEDPWQSGFDEFFGTAQEYALQQGPSRSQVDVDLDEGGRLGAVWRHRSQLVSQSLAGLSIDEHLNESRQLTARGFRPVSISVAVPAERTEPVAASVWHQPAVTAQQHEQLAVRQTNAAAVLLRLGESACVWPLLGSGGQPSVRAVMVQRFLSLGVDPGILLERYASEPDETARQTILLCLGQMDRPAEHDVADALSAWTSSTGRSPLEWLADVYANDPSAGVHSAAEWLMRRWHPDAERRHVVGSAAKGLGQQRRWLANAMGHTLVVFEAGEFEMGSPAFERQRNSDERRHHRQIPRRFALATKETMLRQFQQFLRENPGLPAVPATPYRAREDGPVMTVTWWAAAQYCRWLSEKEGVPEKQMCYPPITQIHPGMSLARDLLQRTGYRLPTEAEWEYASRAGSTTSWSFGELKTLLPDYGWYLQNSADRPQPVGLLIPNRAGLFDMCGNVAEWCHDWSAEYPLATWDELIIDTGGPDTGAARIVRGGSFKSRAHFLRSAARNRLAPGVHSIPVGFRVARTLPPP